MPFSLRFSRSAAIAAAFSGMAGLEAPGQSSGTPRVIIPTTARSNVPGVPLSAGERNLYPWKQNITATVFWIGEKPTARNPTPNNKSSWDQEWEKNFGGYDDPDPANRAPDFRPKAFVPKLNTFYVALPYNDVATWSRHKPEAARVIPWFRRMNPDPGKTTLKGRWLQIIYNGRACYAQWEDCGPWVTDDWQYVFGDRPPKNTANNGAGIDVSPAVRDYLGLRSGEKVHWRFVEASQVPHGPWMKYGPRGGAVTSAPPSADLEAQRRYLEYLRKVRDESFQKKSKWELENGY